MKLGPLFHDHSCQTFSSLHCITIPKCSLDQLTYDRTPHGMAYREAVSLHACDVTDAFMPALEEKRSLAKVAIIDIPRGGVPCAAGVQASFMNAGIKADIISSQCKTDPAMLYSRDTDWDSYQAVILTDGIIGSGKTIVKHFEQIPAHLQHNTIIFANVGSVLGAKTIGGALPHETTLVSGLLIPEEECQWMQFGEKSVYFIGYNDGIGLDMKLPDFGDAVEPKQIIVMPPAPALMLGK